MGGWAGGAASTHMPRVLESSGSQQLQAQGEASSWEGDPGRDPLPPSERVGQQSLSPGSPLTVEVAGVVLCFKLRHELGLVTQKPGPVQRPEERVLLDLMGASCRHSRLSPAGSQPLRPPRAVMNPNLARAEPQRWEGK